MGNFNRGDKFGGSKRFDRDRGFKKGGRSDRPLMHRATCSECNKECEVPFRPTGDKPVYCSSCFGKREESGGNKFERKSFDRQSFGDKKMFEAVCGKCRSECEVPFKPSGNKPIFCDNCFADGGKSGNINKAPKTENYNKQFEMLNNKLDNILKMLSGEPSAPKAVKKEKPNLKDNKKSVEKKTKVKKAVTPKKVGKKVVAKKAVAKKVSPKKAAKKAVAKKKK